jgi:hypothetical protein
MEPKQLADTTFPVDKNIRHIGVVGPVRDYEIKESRMREGAKSTLSSTAAHFRLGLSLPSAGNLLT